MENTIEITRNEVTLALLFNDGTGIVFNEDGTEVVLTGTQKEMMQQYIEVNY